MKRIRFLIAAIFCFNASYAQFTGDAAWRDNAGLRGDAGAKSGAFETNNPINFPAGATSYWHLLDIRHTNLANNFAMQFAGSFFDQNVYVRKTADNAGQAWSRIVTESAGGLIDVNSMTEGDVLRNVFARMAEGNSTGDGTYLGVKTFGTQSAFGAKSFSIEHHFYGSVNSAINFHRGSGSIGGYMTFATNDGTEKMRIDNNGYVGIGTASPSEKLSVNGNIRSKKVIVTQAGWPDYVFDSSYQLPSLDSISTFIQANKHLPDMPSAATVEKDGHDLGEVQKLLLKKMEELTLYILQQQKKIEEIEKVNAEIKRENTSLRNDLNKISK